MPGYHVNKMGEHMGVPTHTHTLILVRQRFSLERVLINRNRNCRIEGPEIRKGALFLTLCSFEPFDF